MQKESKYRGRGYLLCTCRISFRDELVVGMGGEGEFFSFLLSGIVLTNNGNNGNGCRFFTFASSPGPFPSYCTSKRRWVVNHYFSHNLNYPEIHPTLYEKVV